MTYADGFHSHSVIGIALVVGSASMSALYKVGVRVLPAGLTPPGRHGWSPALPPLPGPLGGAGTAEGPSSLVHPGRWDLAGTALLSAVLVCGMRDERTGTGWTRRSATSRSQVQTREGPRLARVGSGKLPAGWTCRPGAAPSRASWPHHGCSARGHGVSVMACGLDQHKPSAAVGLRPSTHVGSP